MQGCYMPVVQDTLQSQAGYGSEYSARLSDTVLGMHGNDFMPPASKCSLGE